MEFTLEQSLSIALKGQCDGEPQCLAAIKAQLQPCIERNPDLEALIAAGGQDDDLNRRVSIDIARCIVDADGNPYFFAHTDMAEAPFAGEPRQPSADTPAIIPW